MSTGGTHFLLPPLPIFLLPISKPIYPGITSRKSRALDFDYLSTADAIHFDIAVARVLETDGEDMQNCERSCFFSAAHAAKDSRIALALARRVGLDLPLARAPQRNNTST